MAMRLLRILVITWLAVFSHMSIASDAYFDHVKDLYLHESNQARNPTQVIRYSDGERGQLLRSVLEPKRIKATLNAYVEFQKRGQKVPEVPKILQPIMARYGEAFKQDPRAYENEYLDSLEAGVEIMASANAMMNVPTDMTPNKELSAKETAEQKALLDSLQALVKMTQSLFSAAYKAFATEIREQVANGMFTDSGAKRALALADKISAR